MRVLQHGAAGTLPEHLLAFIDLIWRSLTWRVVDLPRRAAALALDLAPATGARSSAIAPVLCCSQLHYSRQPGAYAWQLLQNALVPLRQWLR
eukprot:4458924-Pyramimonas_sp.AAC.1